MSAETPFHKLFYFSLREYRGYRGFVYKVPEIPFHNVQVVPFRFSYKLRVNEETCFCHFDVTLNLKYHYRKEFLESYSQTPYNPIFPQTKVKYLMKRSCGAHR